MITFEPTQNRVNVQEMPTRRTASECKGRWRLDKKLGSGAFAEVFQAFDTKRLETVAIKVEREDTHFPHLAQEHEAYKMLFKSAKDMVGFPRPRYYGERKSFNDNKVNVLVMQCVGPSLEQLVTARKRLSIRVVLDFGLQALQRLCFLHSHSLIHRDIKPENMAIGKTDKDRLYLLDLGLAKSYRDPVSQRHIQFGTGNSFVGTPSFASINAHLGHELSRRDDLESLAYVLVYLYNGDLPWNAIQIRTSIPWAVGTGVTVRERNLEICAMKKKLSAHELCRGMPSAVTEYVAHVWKLGFEEEPDYDYLMGLFEGELKRSPRLMKRRKA